MRSAAAAGSSPVNAGRYDPDHRDVWVLVKSSRILLPSFLQAAFAVTAPRQQRIISELGRAVLEVSILSVRANRRRTLLRGGYRARPFRRLRSSGPSPY